MYTEQIKVLYPSNKWLNSSTAAVGYVESNLQMASLLVHWWRPYIYCAIISHNAVSTWFVKYKQSVTPSHGPSLSRVNHTQLADTKLEVLWNNAQQLLFILNLFYGLLKGIWHIEQFPHNIKASFLFVFFNLPIYVSQTCMKKRLYTLGLHLCNLSTLSILKMPSYLSTKHHRKVSTPIYSPPETTWEKQLGANWKVLLMGVYPAEAAAK